VTGKALEGNSRSTPLPFTLNKGGHRRLLKFFVLKPQFQLIVNLILGANFVNSLFVR
jgi:hypothetical protein